MITLKVISLMCNGAILALGIAVLTQGILMSTDQSLNNVTQLNDKGVDLSTSATFTIILGMVLTLTGALGILNVILPKPMLTVCYLALVAMLILSLIIITGYVIWAVTSNRLEPQIEKGIEHFISKYNTDVQARYTIDYMQSMLECCGARGPHDYSVLAIPDSCMNKERMVYSKGCASEVTTWIHDFGYFFICVAILSLMLLVLLFGTGLVSLQNKNSA